jgi:hypothetical protein
MSQYEMDCARAHEYHEYLEKKKQADDLVVAKRNARYPQEPPLPKVVPKHRKAMTACNEGGVMQKMRVFFLRDEHRMPVACVVNKVRGDTIQFATSTYNPIDKFDRKRARTIAEGRFNSGRVTSLPLIKGHNLKFDVIEAIATRPAVPWHPAPQRLRDAAKLWLSHRREDNDAARV